MIPRRPPPLSLTAASLPAGSRPASPPRVRPVFLGALLTLALLQAAAGAIAQNAAEPETGISQKKQQVWQLGEEKNRVEQQLSHIGESEKELQLEIDKLAELVRISKSRKEALEESIGEQKLLIDQQIREISQLEAEVRDSRNRIGLRVRRLYRMAKFRGTAALFQISDFQGFIKDSHYLSLLQKADRKAIREYEHLTRELISKRRGVERNLNHMITLRGELDEETRLLRERSAFLKTSLGDVAKNRTLYRRYLAQLETTMTGMEAALIKLEKRIAAENAKPVLLPPDALRGRLPAPVEGRIIARYGDQDPRYDLKKFQRGIVLRVAATAPVAAVAGGRVVHAGEFRGYQSLVVLDHGRGLYTVYGHLENLDVKGGDWVRQGALLGKATYQPVEEAYDVYFEIRYKGAPDDPQIWLLPGALKTAARPPRLSGG